MQITKIEEARREALRFADLAVKLTKQTEAGNLLYGSAMSDQLWRLSMELERALVEMRKP